MSFKPSDGRSQGTRAEQSLAILLRVSVQSLLLRLSSFKPAQLSLLSSAGSTAWPHSSSSVLLTHQTFKQSHCMRHQPGVICDQKTQWLVVT